MKCPKCGFNSFEYYGICKKCSADLTSYKQTYSINALLLPLEAKEKCAAEYRAVEDSTVENQDVIESHEDIFSFELPDETPGRVVDRSDDPFNFDEPVPENQLNGAKSENDIFADLLESTSQSEIAPFTAQPKVSPATAFTNSQRDDGSSAGGAGEFDFDSFTWDETLPPTPVSGTPDAADDFDSLFGETKDKLAN
jgi:hypothetical protein